MVQDSAPIESEASTGPTLAEEAATREAADSAVEGGSTEELLAGKYKTQEELVAGYKELEAKLGTPAVTETPPATEEAPASGTGQFEIPKAEAAGPAINQDYIRELAADFESNGGKLSEEAYKGAESKGVDRGVLDSLIGSVVGDVQRTRDALISDLGGQDNVDAYLNWAGANYSDAQKEAFASSQSGDAATIRQGMIALQASFEAANGREGTPVIGSGSTGGGGGIYESRQAMLEDQKKPEYKTSEVFRNEVLAKAARSLEAGKI